MKTKVDPLIKMLDHQLIDAVRLLQEAQNKLIILEEEKVALELDLLNSESRYETAQQGPLFPEEHILYHTYIERLKKFIEQKKKEFLKQEAFVEEKRDAVAAIHIEIKTLEKYKENLAEKLEEELKAKEAKELDDIASQNHRRRSVESTG